MLKLLRQSDKLFKYLFAAVLLVVPLYPKFPFLRIEGTYVAVRIEDLLLGLLALIFLVKFFPRIISFFRSNLERSIIVFLLIGFVSLLSAVYITQTAPVHIGALHWLRRIEYLIPFFAAVVYFRGKKDGMIEFVVKLLLVVVLFSFIYGMGQKYLNFPVIVTQNEEYSKGVALRWIPGSHINSTFAGHYDLAAFLALVLPIFVCAFFLLKDRLSKIILSSGILMGLWLLSSAISRISIASYLLGATVALFSVRKYKAIIVVWVVSLVFFAFSTNLLARYTRIIEVTFQKIKIGMETSGSHLAGVVLAQDGEEVKREAREERPTPTPTPAPVFEDRSTSIRLNVEWPRAIRAFKKNPLLGTGYSSITLATDNDYLRLLGEVGLLGFFAFVLIFVNIAKVFGKVIPFIGSFKGIRLAFMAGLLGGIVGTLVNAVFIDVFEASKFATIFWLLMGIAVAQARDAGNEQNN